MKIATTKLLVFLGIIILLISVSLIATNTAFMFTNEIYTGVLVGDIPVGGLTVEAAKEKLLDNFKKRAIDSPITFIYEDQSWTLSTEDIELTLDAHGLAQQAYNIGRVGNIFSCLKERYITITYGQELPLKINYNNDKLNTILKNIAKNINLESQNAKLIKNGSNISIIPEIIGKTVDDKATLDTVAALLHSQIPITVPLVVTEIVPTITSKDLSDIEVIIAQYTTRFDSSYYNRSQNIILAAKKIDDTLVRVGETWSFNDQVGLRLEKYGYKEAPAFINGKLVPDWGGGVCQVTSTLYNAVLLADMSIEERSSHSSPPGYVPLGQDATVADNLIDFKFKNTSPHNVYISTELVGGSLSVYILGKRSTALTDIQIVPSNKKVLEFNTIVKQDPELELGKEEVEEEGHRGFQVTTTRVKSVDGNIVSKELLATDVFEAADHIVRVGTKVIPSAKSNK